MLKMQYHRGQFQYCIQNPANFVLPGHGNSQPSYVWFHLEKDGGQFNYSAQIYKDYKIYTHNQPRQMQLTQYYIDH